MFCFCLFALSACATAGKDIRAVTVVDPKVNLDGYKTYAWLGGVGSVHDPKGLWTPVGFDFDSEIRFLVDTELRHVKYTKNYN